MKKNAKLTPEISLGTCSATRIKTKSNIRNNRIGNFEDDNDTIVINGILYTVVIKSKSNIKNNRVGNFEEDTVINEEPSNTVVIKSKSNIKNN